MGSLPKRGSFFYKKFRSMWITTPTNQQVPLSGEIATYEIERGEVSINHLVGKREIQIYAAV